MKLKVPVPPEIMTQVQSLCSKFPHSAISPAKSGLFFFFLKMFLLKTSNVSREHCVPFTVLQQHACWAPPQFVRASRCYCWDHSTSFLHVGRFVFFLLPVMPWPLSGLLCDFWWGGLNRLLLAAHRSLMTDQLSLVRHSLSLLLVYRSTGDSNTSMSLERLPQHAWQPRKCAVCELAATLWAAAP